MEAVPQQLRLQIVTPDARIFDGEAAFVELPTLDGQLGIYPGHVGLIAGLEAGEIRVHTAAGVLSYVVMGGYIEIAPFLMTVLASFASPEEEKIEEACRRAQAAIEFAETLPLEQPEDELSRLRIELERGKKKMKSAAPVRSEGKADLRG